MAELYAGTSGLSYPTWRPAFYRAPTRARDFLRAYVERLPSVELNATLYELASEEQLLAWAERVRLVGERLGPALVRLRRPGRATRAGSGCSSTRSTRS